jgi:hypothetical protein
MSLKPFVLSLSKHEWLNSTLSDFMIAVFAGRHSGTDCRNPGSAWMDLGLPSMALDTRFQASMTRLSII